MMRHVGKNAGFGQVGNDFFVNSATGLRRDQVAGRFGRILPVSSDGSVPYQALLTAVVGDRAVDRDFVLLFGNILIRKDIEELRGCGKRQAERLIQRVILSEWHGFPWTLQNSLAAQLDTIENHARQKSTGNLIRWLGGAVPPGRLPP